MRTCILTNQKSGSHDKMQRVHDRLGTRPDITFLKPGPSDDVAQALRQAALSHDVFVAAGGDGTVHQLVNALFGRGRPFTLAVLPMGTGNDWCRTLGISLDVDEAIDDLLAARERRMDLIEVTAPGLQVYCVNVASGGFGGQMQEALSESVKKRFGPLAYIAGAATKTTGNEGYRTELVFADGDTLSVDALNLIVANGRTAAGGLYVAPRANPEDGLLEVLVVRQASLKNLLGVAGRLLMGDYEESEDVAYWRAASVSVRSEPPMWFSMDGELYSPRQPVTFRALPGVLSVIVGRSYTSTGAEKTAPILLA